MTIDTNKLRKLAEKASMRKRPSFGMWVGVWQDYLNAANPETVLALLDELAEAKRERDEVRREALALYKQLCARPRAVCSYCAEPMPEADPTEPDARAEWMSAHMETCPDHPMARVMRECNDLRARLAEAERYRVCPEDLCDGSGWIEVDPNEHPGGGVNPCPCRSGMLR